MLRKVKFNLDDNVCWRDINDEVSLGSDLENGRERKIKEKVKPWRKQVETEQECKNEIGEVKPPKKATGNKRNNRMKTKVIRNEQLVNDIGNALETLRGKTSEKTMTDREVIAKNIDKILSLAGEGVSLKSMYELVRQAAGMTISLGTFKHYIGKMKNEMNGGGKHSGMVKISGEVPAEFFEGAKMFLAALGKRPVVCFSFEENQCNQMNFGEIPPVKLVKDEPKHIQ